MISNTPFPEMEDTGRRKFLGKLMAASGQGLLVGKLFPKAASADADGKYTNNMPKITKDYLFRKLNAGVVHVNIQFADGYNGKLPKKMASAGHHQ